MNKLISVNDVSSSKYTKKELYHNIRKNIKDSLRKRNLRYKQENTKVFEEFKKIDSLPLYTNGYIRYLIDKKWQSFLNCNIYKNINVTFPDLISKNLFLIFNSEDFEVVDNCIKIENMGLTLKFDKDIELKEDKILILILTKDYNIYIDQPIKNEKDFCPITIKKEGISPDFKKLNIKLENLDDIIKELYTSDIYKNDIISFILVLFNLKRGGSIRYRNNQKILKNIIILFEGLNLSYTIKDIYIYFSNEEKNFEFLESSDKDKGKFYGIPDQNIKEYHKNINSKNHPENYLLNWAYLINKDKYDLKKKHINISKSFTFYYSYSKKTIRKQVKKALLRYNFIYNLDKSYNSNIFQRLSKDIIEQNASHKPFKIEDYKSECIFDHNFLNSLDRYPIKYIGNLKLNLQKKT